MSTTRLRSAMLLLLVVAIWGVVIFRFVSMQGSEDEALAPIRLQTTNTPADRAPGLAFLLNYSDPFLKSTTPAPPATLPEPAELPETTASYTEPMPEVQLVGIVTSSQKRVALLRLHDRVRMLSEGDQYGEFDVLKIGLTEVQLRYRPTGEVVRVGK